MRNEARRKYEDGIQLKNLFVEGITRAPFVRNGGPLRSLAILFFYNNTLSIRWETDMRRSRDIIRTGIPWERASLSTLQTSITKDFVNNPKNI